MNDSTIDRTTKTQSTLSAAVDRLSSNTPHWTSERVVDEGLDLIRDYCWASSSALYRSVPTVSTSTGAGFDPASEIASPDSPDTAVVAELVRIRPAAYSTIDRGEYPASWFPWGLAPMNPERFIFVEQAEQLPALPTGGATLGDLGVKSCLHLPILERRQPVGYLQVYWPETRLVWDDDIGQILRSLGRFLLGRAVAEPLG